MLPRQCPQGGGAMAVLTLRSVTFHTAVRRDLGIMRGCKVNLGGAREAWRRMGWRMCVPLLHGGCLLGRGE